jgi:hypothetical protein
VAEVQALFATLATKHDQMLATDKWPAMRLDNGLAVGSKGGHGPIRYAVEAFSPGESVRFRFSRPAGFHGIHTFVIAGLDENTTQITHTIEMRISGMALLSWPLAIRWLHDAYIEDAFDKVENHFFTTKKNSKWSLWVKLLRRLAGAKKK